MRSRLHIVILFSLLLPAVFTSLAFARFNIWEPENGVAVRQGDHVMWNHHGVAADGDGYWLVAWSDASGGSQNVFVQLYNSSDEAQWDADGIAVTTLHAAQQDPVVQACANGDWLIGWRDFRRDVHKQGRWDFVVQRLNSNGEPMWEDNGLIVTQDTTQWPGLDLQMTGTNDDGAMFAWEAASQTYVQYIDNQGNYTWGASGYALENALGNAKVALDDDGSILSVSMDFQSRTIFAHKWNETGVQLWPGTIVYSFPENLYAYHFYMTLDGLGGMFIVWKDMADLEIRAQHIDTDGSNVWEYGGVPVSETIDSMYPHYFEFDLIPGGENEFFLARIHDEVGPTLLNVVQKVRDADGVAELCWGNDRNGITLFNDIFINPANFHLAYDGDGGVVVGIHTDRVDADLDDRILLERINANGEEMWLNDDTDYGNGRNILTTDSYQPVVADGTVKLVLRDQYPAACGVRFQSLDLTTGEPAYNDLHSLHTGIDGDVYAPDIVLSGENAFIGWTDSRYLSSAFFRPLLQRLDMETGEYLWEDNGNHVSTQSLPDLEAESGWYGELLGIAPDHIGGVYSVFTYNQPYPNIVNRLHIQRMYEDGNAAWNDDIVLIDPLQQPFEADQVKVAPMPNGDAVVVYVFNNTNMNNTGTIQAQRITTEGQRLWNGTEGFSFEREQAGMELQQILVMPDGETFILFMQEDIERENRGFHLLALDTEGNPLWPNPLNVYDEDLRMPGARMAAVNDGVVVMWLQSWSESGPADLMAQRVNMDGICQWDTYGVYTGWMSYGWTDLDLGSTSDGWIWLTGRDEDNNLRFQKFDDSGLPIFFPNEGVVIPTPVDTSIYSGVYTPRFCEDDDNGMYITFCFYSYMPGDVDMYYTHILSDGTLALADYVEHGMVLTNAIYRQKEPSVTSDGQGGVLATWLDYRGGDGEEPTQANVYAMRYNDNYERVASLAENTLPATWELHSAYPNPFNPATTLRFSAPHTGEISLAVYDVLGRKVATLVDGVVQAGQQQVMWQGCNDQGMPVASGTYFVRLEGENVSLTRRMVLLK